MTTDRLRAVISEQHPLVLGSASPRRRDILAGLGLPFSVVPAELSEERGASESAEGYLERIVNDKLTAVAQRLAGRDDYAALLVADTIVVLDGDILGKPKTTDEAEALVWRLVGRTHLVRTGYALACAAAPGVAKRYRLVESRVSMRAASRNEVRRYAETGEGMDKAGAYAAQGIGAFLVERIEGSYHNVVGLPACEVISDLVDLGLLEHFP
jgi:septum formation protein